MHVGIVDGSAIGTYMCPTTVFDHSDCSMCVLVVRSPRQVCFCCWACRSLMAICAVEIERCPSPFFQNVVDTDGHFCFDRSRLDEGDGGREIDPDPRIYTDRGGTVLPVLIQSVVSTIHEMVLSDTTPRSFDRPKSKPETGHSGKRTRRVTSSERFPPELLKTHKSPPKLVFLFFFLHAIRFLFDILLLGCWVRSSVSDGSFADHYCTQSIHKMAESG